MAGATGAVAPTGRAVRRVALGGDALKSLLGAPILARSQHFVLHARLAQTCLQQLPTETAPIRNRTVDKLLDGALPGLALVVPKRHARRAVTRNLIKRQMRDAVRRRQAEWATMHLLIRLRGAFDALQFPSATSPALNEAVRGELDRLFQLAGAAR
jgi:ribonuclease P protein component